jgi:hypothetical protein
MLTIANGPVRSGSLGGSQPYVLTSQFRETVPKLAIKQDVSSWKLHDGSTLLRVDSTLTNVGKVQIKRVKGTMIVSRLLPETKEQAANYSVGNIFFNCRPVGKAAMPNCVEEQGLNLPSSSKTQLPFEDLSGLEPGESVSYWRYVHLDADVRTVEVYTQVAKPGKTDEWVFDQTFDLKRVATPSRPPDSQE